MDKHIWVQDFQGSVTFCDPQGIILEMNERAAEMFSADGGKRLIGSNILDCHPEPARSRVKSMLENPQLNVYSIEKKGVKKFIYQSPCYKDGNYIGFVELALEIPPEIPHFIRS